ncbi:unnamed protein product [Schistocephalus solidus]|uniref:C2H2-type domain-containing protein n=1 Tax=Schistocephalus solidus TaxID=70667 RepID=A0A183TGV6_SCHSO|nr:unnamed protein product [Schistocephalus solidus]
MRPTGLQPPRPKERHESNQRPGPTPSMPRPFQHARAVNASSARESTCSANSPSDSPTLTPGINSITPTIIETTSQYSSPVTPTNATTTAAAAVTTTSDGDSLLNCPPCYRTFTSRIGLASHLQIHRTETGEPVPGARTPSRNLRLHCPQVLAHSLIEWAYSVTCASMTAEFSAMPTTPIPHEHPPPLPFLPPLPRPLP